MADWSTARKSDVGSTVGCASSDGSCPVQSRPRNTQSYCWRRACSSWLRSRPGRWPRPPGHGADTLVRTSTPLQPGGAGVRERRRGWLERSACPGTAASAGCRRLLAGPNRRALRPEDRAGGGAVPERSRSARGRGRGPDHANGVAHAVDGVLSRGGLLGPRVRRRPRTAAAAPPRRVLPGTDRWPLRTADHAGRAPLSGCPRSTCRRGRRPADVPRTEGRDDPAAARHACDLPAPPTAIITADSTANDPPEALASGHATGHAAPGWFLAGAPAAGRSDWPRHARRGRVARRSPPARLEDQRTISG